MEFFYIDQRIGDGFIAGKRIYTSYSDPASWQHQGEKKQNQHKCLIKLQSDENAIFRII